MKRVLIILMVLSLFLISASTHRVIRLIIINKSGMTLGIRLVGVKQEEIYYFTIPKGDRLNPTSKMFNVVVDNYSMQVYYIEYYDPVYGFQCRSPLVSNTTIDKNMQWSFLECGRQPANLGESSIRKYWPYPIFKFHFVIPPIFKYKY